jgi:hypothetical protein
MRHRIALLAAIAGTILLALPSQAATKTVISDAKGDQFPASGASTDITGLTFQTLFKKKIVNGRTTYVPKTSKVTMSLAAAADDDTWYMVDFDSSGACKSVSLYYNRAELPAAPVTYAQNRAVCQDEVRGPDIAGVAATVSGKNVTWNLPLSAFRVGTKFSAIYGSTTTGVVPSIVLDSTDESKATFKVGQR